LSQWNYLFFYLNMPPPTAWASTKRITLQWYSGSTAVGSAVSVTNGSYGLNTATLGTYQQIAVPISSFGISAGASVDRLRMTFAGTGTVSFDLDNIEIQQGTSGQSQYSVTYTGTWNANTAYTIDDVVLLNGLTYLCVTPGVNQSPATASSTYWKQLGTVTRPVEITAVGYTTAVAAGTGVAYFIVPDELNGWNLSRVAATDITAGTTGGTVIDLYNATTSHDMLSTQITIDSATTSSRSSGTPPVISGSYMGVSTGNIIRIDVGSVSTSAPLGLIVDMAFVKP